MFERIAAFLTHRFKPSSPGDGVGGGLYVGDSVVMVDQFTVAHTSGNHASTSNDDFSSLAIHPDPLIGER